MAKRIVWNNKYLYIVASLILAILIVAEISIVDDYHSSSGSLAPKSSNSFQQIQSSYIVMAKLPGVSVHAVFYLNPSIYPSGNTTAIAPGNGSGASFTKLDFNGGAIQPSIMVLFNTTSGYKSAVPVYLGNGLNFTLTPYNPVFIGYVFPGNHTNLTPSVTINKHYDLIVIQVNYTSIVSYSEVSR